MADDFVTDLRDLVWVRVADGEVGVRVIGG